MVLLLNLTPNMRQLATPFKDFFNLLQHQTTVTGHKDRRFLVDCWNGCLNYIYAIHEFFSCRT